MERHLVRSVCLPYGARRRRDEIADSADVEHEALPRVRDRPASQAPQLVVTTWPGLSVTIRLYMVAKSANDVDADM